MKIYIVLLIALDQIVKLIVKNYYGVHVPIVKNILYFSPIQNTNYSYFNSLFNLGFGRIANVLIVIVVIIIGYKTIKSIEDKTGRRLPIDLIKLFLFSGSICSLIDRTIWNGSLDYIYLKGFFTFDLKDVYLTIFEVIAIGLVVKNWKVLSKLSLKDMIRFIR